MRPLFTWIIALAGAVVAGVAMSFGQTYAPEAIAPLFNSAAPIVAIAGLVAFGSRQIWGAMLLGGLAGPFMMIGYYATAYLMDFDTSAEWAAVWVSVGVVFGVLMGFATWLMRAYVDIVWRAIGASVWPAVAIGEAWHGLARINDPAQDTYWWAQAGVGVFVMLVLAGWRVPSWTARLVTIFLTAIGAALVYVAYGEASAF
jgi:hypothetical protein